MKTYSFLFLIVFLSSCSKVPITGRKQMHLMPESQLVHMSMTQYQEFKENNEVVTSGADYEMVKRVGAKISKAVIDFMTKHHHAKRIKGFDWEFNLVQDDQVNAWCMPGGKVVFYTGILPICQNEEGVAVVMGHEIAHAIARHGNERMSQGMMLQMGGVALNVALSEKSEETQSLFNQAYGIGAGLGVMLPFSRKNELEADKLGLVFMELAGYDSKNAIEFWKRMSKTGSKVPEFLSTHPSDERRVKEITDFLNTDTFKKNADKY